MDFTLKSRKMLSPLHALEHLQDNVGAVDYNNPSADLQPESWAANRSVVYYVPGFSTRGVECWHTGKEFVVRVPPLSSEQDYMVAFSLLEFAGEQGREKNVLTDTKPGKIAIANLHDVFNSDRIFQENSTDIVKVFDAVLMDKNGKYLPGQEANTLYLMGPVRRLVFGKHTSVRIVESIDFSSAEGMVELVDFYYDLMRLVQYPESMNLRLPTLLPMENGSVSAIVTGEAAEFVPESSYIYLNDHSRGCWAALPQEHVREQFSKHFVELEEMVWFDEIQFSIKPIPELKYRRFVKEVAPLCHSINILPSSVLGQHGVIYPVD